MTVKQKSGEALLARNIIDKQSAALVDLEIARLVKPETKTAGKAEPVSQANLGAAPPDDYHLVVTCLEEEMGYPKATAEKASKLACLNFPGAGLEMKIQKALNYLGG